MTKISLSKERNYFTGKTIERNTHDKPYVKKSKNHLNLKSRALDKMKGKQN